MAGIKGMQNLKSKDTRFKKGQSGNPEGRKPIPPELKLLKDLEKKELTETFSTLLKKSKQELTDLINNPDTPAIQHGIARGLRHWMTFGDFRYVQPYIAYIFGFPKQVTELTGSDGKPFIPSTVDLSKIPLDVLKSLTTEKK